MCRWLDGSQLPGADGRGSLEMQTSGASWEGWDGGCWFMLILLPQKKTTSFLVFFFWCLVLTNFWKMITWFFGGLVILKLWFVLFVFFGFDAEEKCSCFLWGVICHRHQAMHRSSWEELMLVGGGPCFVNSTHDNCGRGRIAESVWQNVFTLPRGKQPKVTFVYGITPLGCMCLSIFESWFQGKCIEIDKPWDAPWHLGRALCIFSWSSLASDFPIWGRP